jgi:outer membrane lipoprotein carrier protein
MRWEYRSPQEKLFVSNGKVVWFYVPGEKQARRSDPRTLDDLRSPLAFLLGKAKLEKELRGLSKAVDQTPLTPGDTVLQGVPQAMADQVSEVLLEINAKDQIMRVVLTGIDGATTEFRFSNLAENGEFSDRRFEFAPPQGVEVVEAELGP